MSPGELFLLVLLASGLSAFTGALGAVFGNALRGAVLRRKIRKAIAKEVATGPVVLK